MKQRINGDSSKGLNRSKHSYFGRWARINHQAKPTFSRLPNYAGVASIPSRTEHLKAAVGSIIDQVDQLFAFLNGYPETPSFLDDPRITVFRSQEYGDQHDAGKFFGLRHCGDEGLYFTIDDDIIYPSDYVEKMTIKLKRYDYRVIVGIHGINYPAWPHDVFDRTLVHFSTALQRDVPCSILGTGTAAFRIDRVRVPADCFKSHGMADIWFGKFARDTGIPMIAVARPPDWLKDIGTDASIFDQTLTDSSRQDRALLASAPWGPDDLLARLRSSQTLSKLSPAAALALELSASETAKDRANALARLKTLPKKAAIRTVSDIRRFSDPLLEPDLVGGLVDDLPIGSAGWIEALRGLSHISPDDAVAKLTDLADERALPGQAIVILVDSLLVLPNSAEALRVAAGALAGVETDELRHAISERVARAQYELGNLDDAARTISLLDKQPAEKSPALLALAALTDLRLGHPENARTNLVEFFNLAKAIRSRDIGFVIQELGKQPRQSRQALNIKMLLDALMATDRHRTMLPDTRHALAKVVVECGEPADVDLFKVAFMTSEALGPDVNLMLSYMAGSAAIREHWLNARLEAQGYAPIPPPSGAPEPFDFFRRVAEPVGCTGSGSLERLKVSVIMTAFNSEETIDLAISSILAQSHRNLELVIVDDRSTDDTGSRANRWSKADSRVKVIVAEVNAGPYVGRNTALPHCAGDVIAFQDADDVSHPQRLAKQLAIIERDKVACLARHVRMDRLGRLRLENDQSLLGHGPVTIMFRRSVMEEIGPFDAVRTRGDLEFIGRLRASYPRTAIGNLSDVVLFALHDDASNSFTMASTDEKMRALRAYRRQFFNRNLNIATEKSKRWSKDLLSASDSP